MQIGYFDDNVGKEKYIWNIEMQKNVCVSRTESWLLYKQIFSCLFKKRGSGNCKIINSKNDVCNFETYISRAILIEGQVMT